MVQSASAPDPGTVAFPNVCWLAIATQKPLVKTLFSSDTWAPASRHWLGQLGQEEEPSFTVDEPERNRILGDLQKYEAMERRISEIRKEHEGKPLGQLLGADFERYSRIERAIAAFVPVVDAVVERMSNPDPEFWIALSISEAANIRAWKGGTEQLLTILEAHVSPVEPGPGRPPYTAAAVTPTILGVPQTTFIVAGGLAVGLGILFFALGR